MSNPFVRLTGIVQHLKFSAMVRGFVRLGVIVVALVWVGVAIFHWRHLERDIWLIERHVSPFLGGPMSSFPPTDDIWPVYAADVLFMALPESDRVSASSEFYEENVRPLEELYFVGNRDVFKSWFATTARLEGDEAPVREMEGVLYRYFEVPAIPIAPRLSYLFFSQNALLLTCFVSGAIMACAILGTLAIRWVYRGFIQKQKATT